LTNFLALPLLFIGILKFLSNNSKRLRIFLGRRQVLTLTGLLFLLASLQKVVGVVYIDVILKQVVQLFHHTNTLADFSRSLYNMESEKQVVFKFQLKLHPIPLKIGKS
jgi:hypothetical protein